MSRGPQLMVLSREAVEAYAPVPGQKTVCISIVDPTAPLANLQMGYAACLRFKFHDLDPRDVPEGTMTDVGMVEFMNEDAARTIVEFAVEHADADVLVIHCEAGISRSRSVAEALFDAFGRRAPNQYVYRLILDVFRAWRERSGYDGTLWIDYRWSPARRGPR